MFVEVGLKQFYASDKIESYIFDVEFNRLCVCCITYVRVGEKNITSPCINVVIRICRSGCTNRNCLTTITESPEKKIYTQTAYYL